MVLLLPLLLGLTVRLAHWALLHPSYLLPRAHLDQRVHLFPKDLLHQNQLDQMGLMAHLDQTVHPGCLGCPQDLQDLLAPLVQFCRGEE